MPIYEYECTSCQNVFEEWQSILDEPKTTCPDCAGTLKKIISMTSFKLKGGGWYADGYSTAGQHGKAGSACAASCGKAKEEGVKPCGKAKEEGAKPCVETPCKKKDSVTAS